MMRHFLFLLICMAGSLDAIHAQTFQEELGKAGYYADKYHGLKTASGALYDKTKLTCAHKTLAFGTKIKVTNLENQKSVIVEVNDRGPFKEGFIVDLSRAAAEQIEMIRAGVVRVRIEPAKPTSAINRQEAPAAVAKPTPAPSKTTNADGIRVLKTYTPPESTAKGAQDDQPTTYSTPASPKTKPKMVVPKTVPVAQREVQAPVIYSTEPEPQVAPLQTGAKSRELYQVSLKRPAKEGYAVQLAVLGNIRNGMDEVSKLEGAFPDMILVIIETEDAENPNAASLFKVMLGPYYDKASADKARAAAAKKGYRKAFVVNLAEM